MGGYPQRFGVYFEGECFLIGRMPGICLGEQFVEDDAHGPDITFRCVFLLLENEGIHVDGTTRSCPQEVLLKIVDLPGKTEICYFEFSPRVDQNVGRLKIPVDYAVFDQIFEPAGHLFDDLNGLPLLNPVYPDKMVQIHLASLHHDIEMTVLLKTILQLHNVGVVEALQDRNLLLEANLGESPHLRRLYLLDGEGRRGEDRSERSLSQFLMKSVLSHPIPAANRPLLLSHRFSNILQ